MLRRFVPSEQLKRRSGESSDSLRSRKKSCNSMALPLSPSKKFNLNVKKGFNCEITTDNKVSHEEYIRKILSKPFVIPIDNYKGMNRSFRLNVENNPKLSEKGVLIDPLAYV